MSLLERIKRLFASSEVAEDRKVAFLQFAIDTTMRMGRHHKYLLVPYLVYELRRDGALGSYRHGIPGTIALDRYFAARTSFVAVFAVIEHELAHAYCDQVHRAPLADYDPRFRDMLDKVRALRVDP